MDFENVDATEPNAQQFLAAIVESSNDAVLGKTLDGVITSWNAAAERIYGYRAKEIIGEHISLIIPPDRPDELEPILERLRLGERIEHFETQRVHKDGTILDVSISVSPIRDSDGEVIGASTVARDLTAHKRADREHRSLEERLRQSERLESLGQLAGGIAHDFNNLLTIIINYAGFVKDEAQEQPDVCDNIDHILVAAERAARLTSQLLVFSHREVIRTEPLDLNAIVTDTESLLSRSIGEHITLRVELAEDLPSILADRGQVEQVLLNLAVNARDAMQEGGTLIISTSATELDVPFASVHPEVAPGRYIELSVSDTGIGMSPQVVARIFEPFFTTKPQGYGTGLGLATVYGIMNETGGSISVYSEENLGTTFRLFFPTTPTPALAQEVESEILPQGAGETVLVVEDEVAMLGLTSLILRQNGYVALEASTYEEALAFVHAHRIDLLLTDSVMPHMSGYTLADQVRELQPDVAVLCMSGYNKGVLNSHSRLRTEVDFIQKPFNRRTLLEKVHLAMSPGRR